MRADPLKARLARLKKRSDFLRIAAAKRKYATPGLVLQVAAQPVGLDTPPRIGFTASRKVGGAVLRNRAKRRLRAAADAVMAGRTIEGLDYVLIARPSTPEHPWPDLLAELEAGLKRLKAISAAP